MIGVRVDIISRKSIKPASPTPHHLKTFKLSLLDQLIPPFHGTLIFFYPSQTNQKGADIISNTSQRFHCLQNSLSETLVQFYPLAGQLKDASTIECNDEGAYFVEAQINCQLVDLLSQPDALLLHHFIPTNDPEGTQLASSGCILLVQLTIFECGGMAITVCPSHKIADASSLCTFLRSWTSNNCELGGSLPPPEFIGGSLLPSRDISTVLTMQVPPTKCATRWFMFHASKIASLKAKVGAIGQHYPTNVALVLALILKSAIAASRSKSGSLSPSVLFQLVDLRRKMVPPLQDNAIGNLAWMFPLVFKETHMELNNMVAKMRKGVVDFRNEKLSRFKGDEGFLAVCESVKEREEILNIMDICTYKCTSLCGFPLYEVDFGWGKPTWVTNPSRSRNLIILLDAKCGDGIEGWITLDEQEMAIFERDEELLAFASLNGNTSVNYCRM